MCFPLRPFLVVTLNYLCVYLNQAHPNFIRQTLTFEGLCVCEGIEHVPELYRYFYQTVWRSRFKWVHIREECNKKLISDLPETNKCFEPKFFIVKYLDSNEMPKFHFWSNNVEILKLSHDVPSVIEDIQSLNNIHQLGLSCWKSLIDNLLSVPPEAHKGINRVFSPFIVSQHSLFNLFISSAVVYNKKNILALAARIGRTTEASPKKEASADPSIAHTEPSTHAIELETHSSSHSEEPKLLGGSLPPSPSAKTLASTHIIPETLSEVVKLLHVSDNKKRDKQD